MKSAVLHEADQFTLEVRLPKIDFKTVRYAPLLTRILDIFEGVGPVNLRLARTQQIEVRAVENGDSPSRACGGHKGLLAAHGKDQQNSGAVLSRELTLTVNGEEKTIAEGTTIAGLLDQFGIVGGKVAVERNKAIAPRSSFDEQELEAGDNIEIVRFVGGG